MQPRLPLYRREFVLLGALTLVAAVLRLWSVTRLGLEHFDEGIYAFAGLWIVSPRGLAGLDPAVIPYAPPGFPILVGLCYTLTFPWPGITDLAAITPALACGIATIPISAWVGRRAFGPGAGVAAAAFAALSGPHVAFSRMALTDAPFLLSWLVALGAGMRFLERPGLVNSAACGLAVGLAQNLKYNGWLAGFLIAVTALIGLWDRRRDAQRTLSYGIVATAVALLVYAPWFIFVEHHGGYARLTAHHRGYLGGAAQWLPHLRQQLAQAVALSGLVAGTLTWAAIAWAVAWTVAKLVSPPPAEGVASGWGRFPGRAALLGGCAAFGILPNLSWWLGLVWSPSLIRDPRPGARLLGVWWSVMSVLTPFYHPYARLWLPLTALGWLMAAGLVAALAREGEPPPLGSKTRASRGPPLFVGKPIAFVAILVVAAFCQFGTGRRARPLPALLGPSDSVRRICRSVAHSVAGSRPAQGQVLALLARPPFDFYLRVSEGVPTHVWDRWEALRKSNGAGYALIDEVQLRQEANKSGVRIWLNEHMSTGGYLDELNGPTLLDVDPAAAYGYSSLGRVNSIESPWGDNGRSPRAIVWRLRVDQLDGAKR